jgi:hypothetical protein
MKLNWILATKRSGSTPVHHGFRRECGKRSVLKHHASYAQHSFHPVTRLRILRVARYCVLDAQQLLLVPAQERRSIQKSGIVVRGGLVRLVRVFEVEKQGILQANASHATKRGADERRALPSMAAAAALGDRMLSRWESETAK